MASPSGAVVDVRAWQAALPGLFHACVWSSFASDLAASSPNDRARRLLAHGVVAEPLTLANADDVGRVIAAQFVALEPRTASTGIGIDNAEMMYTRIARARAAFGDPLSVVLRVGGTVEGVALMWDHNELLPMPTAALLAGMPKAWRTAWIKYMAPLLVVDDRLEAMLRERGGGDGPSGDGAPRPPQAHWIEFFIGAVREPLHVFSNRRERSLTQELHTFILDRVAESGVYTHVSVHTHGKAYRAWEHLGERCQYWRLQTGAPSRLPQWDVRLDGHGEDPDSICAVAQIRPWPTHAWRRPEAAARL